MIKFNFCVTFFTMIFIGYLPQKSFSIDSEYSLINRLNLLVKIIANTVVDIFHLNNDDDQTDESVTVWCSNSDNPMQRQVHKENIQQIINLNHSITFLIHGWTDNRHRTWIKNILTDFIIYSPHKSNICIVDWNRLGLTDYSIAVQNTKTVSKYLADFIKYIVTFYNIKLSDITLVGHSLGAQISGQTGKTLHGQLGMIIGLDTAGLLFTRELLNFEVMEEYLTKNDAKFVQCIHTDYKMLGSNIACGDQDYYVNGGYSPQPGCTFPLVTNGISYNPILCSHFKAVEYFRYSLNPVNVFNGQACDSYRQWNNGDCNQHRSDNFGIYARKENAVGKLYLNTTVWPPYYIKN